MQPRSSLALSTLVLIAAACSSTASTTTATTTTEAPTTTEATSTTSSTTEATTTSTTSTTAVTTTAPKGAFTETAAVYRVVDVADDDVLNVRSDPGVTGDLVAEYAATATDVLTTGRGATIEDDGAPWVEVIAADFTGWVNKRFLELVDQSRAPLGEFPCSVGPGMTGTLPDVWPAPAGESNADHVFSIEHIEGGGCSRTVITLGTEFDWERAGIPADRVPSDVAGVDGASPVRHVLVDMPTVYRAAPEVGGSAHAFLVRKTDGPTESEQGQHGLLANVPSGPGVHNVLYLENPARVVIDHWFSPTLEGRERWTTGTGVILINPPRPRTGISTLSDGAQFNGYARGFEASLSARIIQFSSGLPIIVTWTPNWGGDTVTSDVFTTTVNDWTEAWGQFSFEVSGLPRPGGYTLVLSTDNAADSDEFESLEFPFAISP